MEVSMRSLFALHQSRGPAADFAEYFAAEWHSGDWDLAEDHWELLVNRLLNSRDMEKLKPSEALRRAEQEAVNFGLALLRSSISTRCPICAIAPQRSEPDTQRTILEPR
ncbi:hypothetical protein DN051_06665 [Streptomyces cadmiisoli]|uniref:Uncharacterized protein n=1 Tax=Streptomyces cadmiisoli TaxID=2184053 RepID=A0A2Z4ITC0_9ACTN|nr:hypothetical protein DN051_06665 [Streptomyces cadmiisoli]